ncbi:MAG: hypothetical protein COW63_16170 [Bacteroidetes bacterium CG18_big_fil_WC_8_21_14_2_50_41_14]|nr:MAG: hypothetical protein COW63_16170 [Bacteroidetes bacterium CG18_big_fil_WC_8_21_14_2_50_41_14]PJB54731.1 MAG: hypothetical protein CO098_20140 [Bacteroidetes bacterium CG_4_9_14_3_um_filter_41_19]
MKIRLKIVGFLLLAILWYQGLVVNSQDTLFHSSLQNTQSESVFSFFSGNTFDLFCVPVVSVNMVTSIVNLPIPTFKNQSNDFSVNTLIFDLKMVDVVRHYLVCSIQILPGLTIREQIYPFHYFW